MKINRLLSAREYKWVDYPSIPTKRGRAKRFLKQFTPERLVLKTFLLFSPLSLS